MVGPQTKKLKYFSYAKVYEYKNKFGKGWLTGSELMTVRNISTLPTLKCFLSNNPFIKCAIFEVTVNFPPRVTPIGIVAQYCEHHNISYISHSTTKKLWDRDFYHTK